MIIVRIECDVPGCEAYVATDIMHPQGMEFGAYVRIGHGAVTIDGRLRLPEGWTGDAQTEQVRCPAHRGS